MFKIAIEVGMGRFTILALFILIVSVLAAQQWEFAYCLGEPWYNESVSGFTIDSAGDCIVWGTYEADSTNIGGFELENAYYPLRQMFVGKMSSDGDWLWVIHSEGQCKPIAFTGVTDSENHIFLSGRMTHEVNNATMTVGDVELSPVNLSDAFVLRISPEGETLWGLGLGGMGYDRIYSTRLKSNGDLLALLEFASEDIEIGDVTISTHGGTDGCLLEIDSDGDLVRHLVIGGADYECFSKFGLTGNDKIVLTGHFESQQMNIGSTQLALQGEIDAFVCRLNDDFTVDWVDHITGPGRERYPHIGMLPDDAVYVRFDIDQPVNLDNIEVSPTDCMKTETFGMMNAEGEWQWATTAGSGYYFYTIAVDRFPDSDLLIGYNTYQDSCVFDGVAYPPYDDYNGMIGRFDDAGQREWLVNTPTSLWGHTSKALDNGQALLVAGVNEATVTLGELEINVGSQGMLYMLGVSETGEWEWAIPTPLAVGFDEQVANVRLSEDGDDVWALITYYEQPPSGPVPTAFFIGKLNCPVTIDDPAAPAPPTALTARPNPFNPETTVCFSLAQPAHARLTVYNIRGQQVATLLNETRPAGDHEVVWRADGLASGVYFATLRTGDETTTTKLLLLK